MYIYKYTVLFITVIITIIFILLSARLYTYIFSFSLAVFKAAQFLSNRKCFKFYISGYRAADFRFIFSHYTQLYFILMTCAYLLYLIGHEYSCETVFCDIESVVVHSHFCMYVIHCICFTTVVAYNYDLRMTTYYIYSIQLDMSVLVKAFVY